MPLGDGHAPPKRRDLLTSGPATHPDDDGAGQDGIGQVAESGQCHGAIGRVLDRFYALALDDTAAGNGALAVSRVEQTAHILMLPRPRPEDGVDLVIENRGTSLWIIHLAKDVGRRDIDGFHRSWHQEFRHFQRPRFA
jgi:hypothetical protein